MMKSSCCWPGHALPNSAYRYNPYMHTFMYLIHLESQRTPRTNHRLRNVHASFSSNEYVNTLSFLGFQANYHEQPGTINHLHITPAKMASDDVSSLAVGVNLYSMYQRDGRKREREIHVNDVIISAMLMTLPKATRCRVHRCSSSMYSTYHPHQ